MLCVRLNYAANGLARVDFASKLATHQASTAHMTNLTRATTTHVRQAWNETNHDLNVDNEQFVNKAVADLMWDVTNAMKVKMVAKLKKWKVAKDNLAASDSDQDMKEIDHDTGLKLMNDFYEPAERGLEPAERGLEPSEESSDGDGDYDYKDAQEDSSTGDEDDSSDETGSHRKRKRKAPESASKPKKAQPKPKAKPTKKKRGMFAARLEQPPPAVQKRSKRSAVGKSQ